MHILITGNMGYVGPCVVRHLRRTDPACRIVGFDMGYFSHCVTAPPDLPERLLDVQYFGDVRRPLPPGVLTGLDAVVHLAAISNDPIGSRFEAVTEAINARATVAVARQAKAAGARRFVFASSCSVYGSGGEGPRTERSPVAPLTAYARSKHDAEQQLRALADESFIVTCLRFATACGMSDRLRLDLVLNDFVASAVSTGRITMLSDGTPWRPLIHVRDMARAIEWALERPAADGDFLTLNAGSDEWNFQVRDLAEAVAHEVGQVTVTYSASAQPDKRSYRVDFEQFRTLAPGHQPTATLSGTIADLVDGLRRMEFHDPEFRTSNLIRLEVLQRLRRQGLLTPALEWVETAGQDRGEDGRLAASPETAAAL